MGKLQYINRKIEGSKLGQVVAKDLRKRIPPGLGSKAAARDPQVELDVTNKGINDDAAAEIFDALASSISNEAGTTKLEDLKFRDNALTARSLGSLAKVIRAARLDLRDIDLSNNAISIKTAEDAVAWEEFLSALGGCIVMRRLDLSGNTLGPKAFERLQKLYLREPLLGSALDVASDTSRSGSNSVEDLTSNVATPRISDEEEDSECEPHTPLVSRIRKQSTTLNERPGLLTAELRAQYASTSGLRSIPYICLFDCNLTDACAMYLSFIIEQHALVAELLPKVPPPRSGAPASQIEAYDMVKGCNGIIWKPNPSLSEAGIKVLELSEQARINVSEGIEEEDEQALTVSPMLIPRKASDTPSPFTPTLNRQRRGSFASGGTSPFPTTPGCAIKANTLMAVRNRLQVETIKDHGAHDNELWHKALNALALARPILCTDEAQGSKDGSPRDILEDITSHPSPKTDISTPLDRISENVPRRQAVPESSWPRKTGQPEVKGAISPKQTLVFRLNTNKQTSILEREQKLKLKMPDEQHGVRPVVEVVPAPERSPKLPRKRYRTALPMGLSAIVWGRILGHVMDETCICSTAQLAEIVRYASSRKTLIEEYHRLGKQEHAQIWKILEQMGCLTYA